MRPASTLTKEDETAVNTLAQRVKELVEQLQELQQYPWALDLSFVAHRDPLELPDLVAPQMFTSFEHKQIMLEMFSKRGRLQWLISLLNTELEERLLDKLMREHVARLMPTLSSQGRNIIALSHIRRNQPKPPKTLADLAGSKVKSYEEFLSYIDSPEVQREISEALSDPETRRIVDEIFERSMQGRLPYFHRHLMKKIDLAIVSLFHESGIGFQQELREAAGKPGLSSKQLADLASNEIRAVKYRLGVKRGRHRDNPEETLKKLITEKKDFIKKVKAAKKKLLKKGRRVTKTAVAQELGMGGINEKGTDSRRQVLDGKLKKYGLTFDEI